MLGRILIYLAALKCINIIRNPRGGPYNVASSWRYSITRELRLHLKDPTYPITARDGAKRSKDDAQFYAILGR